MKISLNWLKQYVKLDGVSTDELKRAVTFLGFEVEGVATTGLPPLTHVVVGEILTRTKIPNLKKDISLCAVDVGASHGGVRSGFGRPARWSRAAAGHCRARRGHERRP